MCINTPRVRNGNACFTKTHHHQKILLKNDPYGNRTHVTAVKGPCLNRLTNGPYLTPRAGFEPATLRLTAECSTAELSRTISLFHNLISATTYSPRQPPAKYLQPIWSSLSCSEWARVFPQFASSPKFFKVFIPSKLNIEDLSFLSCYLGQVLDLLV